MPKMEGFWDVRVSTAWERSAARGEIMRVRKSPVVVSWGKLVVVEDVAGRGFLVEFVVGACAICTGASSMCVF